MGNPNVHNHKRCPLFLAGKAGGQLKGGLHLKAPDGTPMANVFLTMVHMLGMDDMQVVRRQHGRVRPQRRQPAQRGSATPAGLDPRRPAARR